MARLQYSDHASSSVLITAILEVLKHRQQSVRPLLLRGKAKTIIE